MKPKKRKNRTKLQKSKKAKAKKASVERRKTKHTRAIEKAKQNLAVAGAITTIPEAFKK